MQSYGLSLRVAVAGLVLGFAPLASADETTLAAGAGFRRPLADIATAYQAQSGHKILQTYGHLGQVIAQARESGQISILCGDAVVLQSAKGIAFARMARLGLGKLVVAYRKGVTLTKPEDLATASFARLGIPDQANAIYGKAGRQFLERAQLDKAIDPKLIAVATVPQVTSYVANGEIDAGFVNATDAIGAGDTIGGFIEVPDKFYDPVEVSCGVLAAAPAASTTATQGFIAFLETEPARKILQRYGL
ncbi:MULTISPECIES: molybdate ABC transporter substrate-binding protein [unclassified Beijerinckia]|uniref:molybdate ABC transporter substrate-binding protein n=1 Tax=unclassified Beijerinckia TaxID=2638183 RepID=UPI00089CDA6F|nr:MULTISPECIES: molybdate ABC transporter substrate-binding protein [unclassified Beijerinckia]MDH7799366.1 molybdate transport system substrate-binding protein [Beijerinckia sp. GAS462]SED47789.1 molybdate transport system substrate-binding protein [Beijerinckia sp. 28-YEA-48]